MGEGTLGGPRRSPSHRSGAGPRRRGQRKRGDGLAGWLRQAGRPALGAGSGHHPDGDGCCAYAGPRWLVLNGPSRAAGLVGEPLHGSGTRVAPARRPAPWLVPVRWSHGRPAWWAGRTGGWPYGPLPGPQPVSATQVPLRLASPSTPRRARLTAAASRAKSAATLTRPRTRARRPPCRRRIRWPILRSTLGRVAV